MKARIYTRDGHSTAARTSLSSYIKAKGKKMDKEAEELDLEIKEGQRLKEKTGMERKAQLWNACMELASEALRVASRVPAMLLPHLILWQKCCSRHRLVGYFPAFEVSSPTSALYEFAQTTFFS